MSVSDYLKGPQYREHAERLEAQPVVASDERSALESRYGKQ